MRKDIKYRRNSFYEIVERIKDIISFKHKGRVLDKYVADELELNYNTFRYYKCKNILPYDRIVVFCVKYEISFDWLVFDKSFKVRKFAGFVKNNK